MSESQGKVTCCKGTILTARGPRLAVSVMVWPACQGIMPLLEMERAFPLMPMGILHVPQQERMLAKRGWPFQAGFEECHTVQKNKHHAHGTKASQGHVS